MQSQHRETLLTTALLLFALLLQSTLFQLVSINGVVPDIALIVLIFASYRKGTRVGLVSGFFSGFFEDFMSLTPLGFNSLVRTIIGFLYGLLYGSFVIDTILIPILFTIVATIMKAFLSWLTSFLFAVKEANIFFLHFNLLIEVIYNSILAPFIFGLLKLFRMYRDGEKEKVRQF